MNASPPPTCQLLAGSSHFATRMLVDISAEGSSDVTVAATPDAVDLSALIAFSTEDIDKPDLDDRKYRYLKLANNLQLLLVSDPECDHAAACADVAVGSASDPEELPGLAHFLEHMLFLGTAKYPAENAYQSFLEQHGGSSNAFTQHENTTCAPTRAPACARTFLSPACSPSSETYRYPFCPNAQTISTSSTRSCSAHSTGLPNSFCARSSPRAPPSAR